MRPEPDNPRHARVTRLAPSPTGALHLGNARTFLINWAIARQRGWRIILRIEDLDTPRIKPGATRGILETLRWLGLDWDPWPGAPRRPDAPPGVLVQSHDLDPYRFAMRSLAAAGRVYPCVLTRAEIEAAASAPQEGSHETPFPAALRPPLRPLDFDALSADSPEANWRFAVPAGQVSFVDECEGPQSFEVSRIIGDFVVWTRRAQPAYQLAVVVDDHRQGVTDVVRGADLMDSAARQLLLYRALGLEPEPRYTHLPLVVGPDGRRLAKRHGDTRVDHYRARGVPVEAIVGLVAAWSIPDCRNRPSGLTAREFLRCFDLATMPRMPVIFRPEDDRWLLDAAP